jgi:hypothetical protein
MAQKKRLSPNQKAELKADLAGLKTIADYRPAKDEFKTADVVVVDEQLDTVEEQISQTKAHLSDLLNQSADLGALYLKKSKGVRQQVIGQYGDDSPEYEAVGGKRTSNRRSGLKRGNASNNGAPVS